MPFRKARYTGFKDPYAQIDISDPLARGLKYMWLFGEKGGTIAVETVAGMRDGTYTATATPTPMSTFTAGYGGSAPKFDGTTQFVSTTISDLSYPAGTIAWRQRANVAFNGATTQGMWGMVGGAEFSAQLFADNNLYIGWRAGSSVFITNTAAIWNQGLWANWVFTWSATDSVVYVDGLVVGNAGGAPTVSNIGSNLTLAQKGVGAVTFNGAMELFQIWNRALSASEVRTLYAEPLRPLRALARPLPVRKLFVDTLFPPWCGYDMIQTRM